MSPEELDALTPHQLISEIRQIAEQYSAEVLGSRRNWPESIRSRILALGRLGVAKKKISELTGIPSATVFFWCRELPRRARRRPAQGQFIELSQSPILTVGIPAVVPGPVSSASGLSLRTPMGFVFEGLPSVDEVERLYRSLTA